MMQNLLLTFLNWKFYFQRNISSYCKTGIYILAQCVKLNRGLGMYCLSIFCFIENITIMFQEGAEIELKLPWAIHSEIELSC